MYPQTIGVNILIVIETYITFKNFLLGQVKASISNCISLDIESCTIFETELAAVLDFESFANE